MITDDAVIENRKSNDEKGTLILVGRRGRDENVEVNARLKNCNVNVKIILIFCLFQIYGGEKYHRFEV